MNAFDAAVCVIMLVAVIAGFRSGLLRSLATIFGYACAAPIAVALTPRLEPILDAQLHLPQGQAGWVFIGVFLVVGVLLAAMSRTAVGEMTGKDVGAADRMAGAMLGAIRIVLLAVLMVLVFDRLIPPGREPAFLTGSRLRPILSAAGAQGLRALPPDVIDYIDRIKRERGL
jgi:membrane protein required for colicin V production